VGSVLGYDDAAVALLSGDWMWMRCFDVTDLLLNS
jgi:hypothetical protein